MAVGALEPEFWRKVCAALDLPELIDEAFAPARVDDPRFQKIAAAFGGKTRAEWTAIFDGIDACVEPVLTFGEAMAEEAYRKRGAVAPMIHPDDGEMPVVCSPIGRTAGVPAPRGPEVGEHTRAALGEVGFPPEEIDRLIAAGCVQAVGASGS
jgi:crotonobetainyl-CoA:carnitine CoA-transferase CaiB-like acyl-CoA transferase